MAVRATVLLLLANLFSFHFLSAQSQAQAGEEQLEFQHRDDPRRSFTVLPGDRVRYPEPSKKFGPERRGDVVSWTDSTLTVQHPRTKVETVINLRKARYVSRVHKKRKTWGSIFAGLFVGLFMLMGTSTLLFYAFHGFSLAYSIFAAVIGLFFNPVSIVLLGIAIPLLATATRKAKRKKWRYRFRSLFVRNPQP